ncbi:protein FAM107B isoform X1 [Schistocerca cancellata]|uniref:protein FAM107B isoform X1 n=1 Tax=Schistocerca cancellata TaxID=274614 RepID=UPI002118FF24|nr:protein FAM107B isoform X1 [Schistocerca cancellata]
MLPRPAPSILQKMNVFEDQSDRLGRSQQEPCTYFRSGVAGLAMIPEAEVETRNTRHTTGGGGGTAPPAPPLPPVDHDGLILPRKLQNPCMESADRRSLHRELLFNQKTGKNVLNQKSELQRAFGRHREQQARRELEQQKASSLSDLQRLIEERQKRLLMMEKDDDADSCSGSEPEFMKVHARLRSKMDSK